MKVIEDFQINLISFREKEEIAEEQKKSIDIFPAIVNEKCYRCGYSLKKELILNYCPNCLEFGKVKTDSFFIQNKRVKENEKKSIFKYKDKLNELTLSINQAMASKYINSSYQMNKDCLIHAVCGAGKTEITFDVISQVLKKNEYIAFAIPRIDILYEIAERLKYYFPKTSIVVLNSQEPKGKTGQIYVMTTNQVIKFKKIFSLIIVDEVDAFPYEYNKKFDYGVEHAKKKDGVTVYLTSTPSQKFIKKNIPTFRINRRWHYYLLPVPKLNFFNINILLDGKIKKRLQKKLNEYEELKSEKQEKSESKLNDKIIEVNQQKEIHGKQLLIFISNIKNGEKLEKIFLEKGYNIPFVSSTSKERKEIVEKFRRKEFNVLLSTTILERGVTFDDVDVIVLDSSSKLYNKASLIQIAGRVNRKKENQSGNVYFFHQGITRIMEEAIEEIKKSNL